jgi:hypothetical protein
MKSDIRKSDTAVGAVIEREGESAKKPLLSGFVVFPMPWPTGNVCQTLVDAQYALYQLASKQAAVAVQASRHRRQLLFARGGHLWN